MDIQFSIRSKCFSLYKAFREEAEKVGWFYNAEFNSFDEGKMKSCNCLFFSSEWSDEARQPKFSFSNCGTDAFYLPEDWDRAIEYMIKVFNGGRPKQKLIISIKNLAAHHGVEVEDIIITS